jgi:hypothetical protein
LARWSGGAAGTEENREAAMNPKSTWTLVALAAVLFAFIFFFERHLGRNGNADAEAKALPELRAGLVTSVVVRPAGQLEIRAERADNCWRLTKPSVYPAQGAMIEELLRALEQLDCRDRITAQELKSTPQADKEFGFDPPAFSLIVQQGESRIQILVGRLTALRDQVFLQVVGKDGVFTPDAGLLRLIPQNPNYWRDTALVNLSELKFDRLTVTNGDKMFEIDWDASSKLWRLTRPLQARADNPRIEDLLQKLQQARVAQFVTDDPKADLESFGLQLPDLVLALNRGTNVAALLQFGRSPSNDSSQIYARRAGQSSILLIPAEPISPWRGPHTDFRDRHLISLAPGIVDIVDVRGAADFALQRLTNDIWQIVGTNTFAADAALVRDLLGGLCALEVVQFVKDVVTAPDLPNYGLEPPSRRYILQTALPVSASGGTNRVIAELIFGATQGDRIYARRADESSVYAVKFSDYQKLPAAGWQLRDRRVWNFAENEVNKITVRRNGKPVELIHIGTNQWAFAPGSQGIINNFAVEEAAYRLGHLTAVGWVDIGAQNRPRYGFSENPDQITVETRKGAKLTVEFGGFSPQPQELLYAATVLDGQTRFFAFPLPLYDYIQTHLSFAPSAP